MKFSNYFLMFCLFSLMSCGGIAKLGCNAVGRGATRTAANSTDDILRNAGRTGLNSTDDILRAQRLGLKPPIVPNGGIFAETSGSSTAKSVVTPSSIELKVLNSSGQAISTLNNTSEIYLQMYAQNMYRQQFINVVDDVFVNLEVQQIRSAKVLEKEIKKAIKASIGESKAFTFNASEGVLTYEIQTTSLQLSGSIKISEAIKDGLIVGGAGYYVAKHKL